MAGKSENFFKLYGYDLLLASIAAFYVFAVPYTKVEESFNVQAMHDILYHKHHLEQYDHFDFPGVVPRTFVGAFFVSILASPIVLAMNLVHLPKLYSLYVVRLVLGCITLFTLRFFRVQIRKKFGYQVEAFFVILTASQFHVLFYCSRPLPNVLAFCLVNLAYGYWLRGSFYAALRCLIFATIIFRCDILLLLAPLGLELLLTKSISLWKAVISCFGTAICCIGLTIVVDSVMWRRLLWPEFEVFWFNSVLNRSSEWGTHPFHWYFTSALPRSLLASYPLFVLGVLLDRRISFYVLPVLSFVLLYSKLPHKELRFIISSIPIFNLSAAIAASRLYVLASFSLWKLSMIRNPFKAFLSIHIHNNEKCIFHFLLYCLSVVAGSDSKCNFNFMYRYNNRRKSFWNLLYIGMLGLVLGSLGCTLIFFMASYENYPSGYALKALHSRGNMSNYVNELQVHIDTFSAINGISRFCENDYPWRYSKEEGIHLEEFQNRNFTFLLNEHSDIEGFKCLFTVNGFSGVRLQKGFPPISLVKEPKVFVHGNIRSADIMHRSWPQCTAIS